MMADMAIIAVDKPIGPTSHDIVAGARRQLATRRVGHAGTLDPLASGVLLLLSGQHTKLSPFLTASDKTYLAWITFGATTATLDAEGPLEPFSGPLPDLQQITAALPAFLQLTSQLPPAFSAIKLDGVKGYEAARKGRDLELPVRPARYHDIELLGFAAAPALLPATFSEAGSGWQPSPQGRSFELPPVLAELPTALLRVTVAAGTYIRAFARDLGAAVGSAAFLSGLVRTAAGRVDLSMTVPADQLAAAASLDPLQLLPWPKLELPWELARRVRQGQRLRPDFTGRAVLHDPDGQLVAIAEEADGRMKLLGVWPAADTPEV
jgi:tRNA pseudouridine55 synthase